MLLRENIIKAIRISLSNPLPGEQAQLRMAPSHRGGLLKDLNGSTARNSAVLISLFPTEKGISTLFIKRASYDGVHSGQVSFPGGKCDDTDKSLIHTALREADEEVGIQPNDVEILGSLTPLFIPVSNMMVLPVIGLLEHTPIVRPNSQEVDYTITVPICHLKNPNNHRVKTLNVRGYSITTPYISYNDEEIWGATAMIISEFIELFTC